MRWLQELLRPELKCERLGHRMETRRQRVYLYPSEGVFRARHVADRAAEEFGRCCRCGEETQRRIVNRTGLNGLSLPAADYERLEAEGRLAVGGEYLVARDAAMLKRETEETVT